MQAVKEKLCYVTISEARRIIKEKNGVDLSAYMVKKIVMDNKLPMLRTSAKSNIYVDVASIQRNLGFI